MRWRRAPPDPTLRGMSSPAPPPRPNRPVYLDNQATTRCDPRVVAAMLPWFTEHYGNPHSVEHVMGTEAEAAVEDARAHVAALIGADAKELVFTSGATESNNIAIKGAARYALRVRQRTPAHRHRGDRAQMRPGVGGRSRRGRLRAGVPAGAPRWAAGSRRAARGPGRADPAGQRHGGEQRDRRGPGHPGAGRDRQAGRRAVPHRYRPGDRQDPARPDRAGRSIWPRSAATRSTGRRASARCMSGAGRACGWRRCSPAAARSAGCAPAPCPRR